MTNTYSVTAGVINRIFFEIFFIFFLLSEKKRNARIGYKTDFVELDVEGYNYAKSSNLFTEFDLCVCCKHSRTDGYGCGLESQLDLEFQ